MFYKKSKNYCTLLSCLVLSASLTLFTACGGSSDPSSDTGGGQTNNGNTNNGQTNNGQTNNGQTNNGQTNNGTANNGTANNTNNSTANNTNNANNSANNANNTNNTNNSTNNTANNTNNTSNNGGNNSNPDPITPEECKVNQEFFGQIGSNPDDAHSGGQPTTESYSKNANLDKVISYIKSNWSPDSGSDGGSGDGDGSGDGSGSGELKLSEADQIDIKGALVTATSFGSNGNVHFWLQDANEVIQVFLPQESPPTDSSGSKITIKVGQVLNFTVTKATVYGGTPEITGIKNVEVAEEDRAVPYIDTQGKQIKKDHLGQIVKVTGVLTEKQGPCGGNRLCYTMTRKNGSTITFRSNRYVPSDDGSGSNNGSGSNDGSGSGDGSGDGGASQPEGYFIPTCITWVGPLSQHPGRMAEGGDSPTLQLNHVNYAWTQQFQRDSSGSGSDDGSQ